MSLPVFYSLPFSPALFKQSFCKPRPTMNHQPHHLFSQAPPPNEGRGRAARVRLRDKQSGADSEALPLRGCRFIARV